MNQAAEDLRAASDLIRFNGLAKGEFQDEDNKFCTLGALRTVIPGLNFWLGNEEGLTRLSAAKNFVYQLLNIRSIIEWNDDPSTTADMVADKLLEAAKLAEA